MSTPTGHPAGARRADARREPRRRRSGGGSRRVES